MRRFVSSSRGANLGAWIVAGWALALGAACTPLEEPTPREPDVDVRDPSTGQDEDVPGGELRRDAGRRDATSDWGGAVNDARLDAATARDGDVPSASEAEVRAERPDASMPPAGSAAEAVKTRRGQQCSFGTECQTGACVDGVCCTKAACGACEQCVESGNCEPVLDATDEDSCTGSRTCDQAGVCKLGRNEPCTQGMECASGACLGGRCCATACGPCSTCGAPGQGGLCAPSSGDDPASCPLPNTCGAGSCAAVDVEQLSSQMLQAIPKDGWIYQTFTVGRSGRLVEVRVDLRCSAAEDARDLFVDIMPTGPNDEWLGTALGGGFAPDSAGVAVTVSGSSTPLLAFKLRQHDGVGGPRVVAGDRFLLRVHVNSEGGCFTPLSVGDRYAGGAGRRYGDGEEIIPESPYDYVFQIVIAP